MIQAVKRELRRNWGLYLLLLPTLVYVLVFLYGPMGGILIAFEDYKAAKGIFGSTFVGFKHFAKFFSAYNCWELIRNTLILSLYTLLAGFPLPIVFALMINNMRSTRGQNFVKTVSYAPHFISVIVLIGMLNIFMAPSSGIVVNILNQLRALTGLPPETLGWLTDPDAFPHLYVWSGIWQELGWGSIIYLAALAGISPDLYEAASMDGATRLQKIWHIELPGIMPTMVTLLILNTGNLLSVGFEKALLMQNNMNITRSEIISTYVYHVGLNSAQYSYSTAIGLFNSIINLVLLLIVNKAANRLAEVSLW